MKFILLAMYFSVLLSGCMVQPVGVRPIGVGVNVGVGRPHYARPGGGYMWRSHPRYGWGWHHRHHGWHRGWL